MQLVDFLPKIIVYYWNSIPEIQYIIIFFMILAGTNYLLIYSAFIGKFKKLFNNTEFIWYLSFIAVFVLVTTLVLFLNVDLSNTEFDHPEIYGKFESSFRHVFFKLLL